ncbi:Uncharacterized protein FWK35_00032816, partial [Aphis craccivora]
SERSDECIDFTMMFWSSKNASMFKLSPVYDRKFKFLRNMSKSRKFAGNFEVEIS